MGKPMAGIPKRRVPSEEPVKVGVFRLETGQFEEIRVDPSDTFRKMKCEHTWGPWGPGDTGHFSLYLYSSPGSRLNQYISGRPVFQSDAKTRTGKVRKLKSDYKVMAERWRNKEGSFSNSFTKLEESATIESQLLALSQNGNIILARNDQHAAPCWSMGEAVGNLLKRCARGFQRFGSACVPRRSSESP